MSTPWVVTRDRPVLASLASRTSNCVIDSMRAKSRAIYGNPHVEINDLNNSFSLRQIA